MSRKTASHGYGRAAAFLPLWLALICMAGWVGGCATARPATHSSPVRLDDHAIDLRPYLASEYAGDKAYMRYRSLDSRSPQVSISRSTLKNGRVEGSLRGPGWEPLGTYLDPHSNRPSRARAPWPARLRGNVGAFLVEFTPALVEWPLTIAGNSPHRSVARLLAFDGAGVPFARGPASRTVWLVGSEDVSVDGTLYRDCVKLRAVTTLGFGWWATVRFKEEAWFARDVGIVRRVQKIEGRALVLFPFSSSYTFDLQRDSVAASPKSDGRAKASVSLHGLTRWKRLAIHLDRVFPSPRIGGLRVESEAEAIGPP